MSKGRSLKAIAAGALVSVALVACGGGGGRGGSTAPSALDPANMVPASAVLYASVTIRPQGSIQKNLIQAVNSIAGAGTAQRLGGKLDKELGAKLGKEFSLLKSWLGQRVGVALIGFPSNFTDPGASQSFLDDLLVVAPTGDPSAARRQLASKFNKTPGATGKVVGHYVIFGGRRAVQQALSTTSQNSLASDARYKAAMAELGGNGLFSFYASAHRLLTALLPAIRARSQITAAQLAAADKAAPPGSAVGFGLTTTANEFRMDLAEEGMPQSTTPVGAAADVSSLPSGSWLALSLAGGLASKTGLSALTRTLPRDLASIQAATRAAGHAPNAAIQFVERDLLPALGPISLSVSGTTKTDLKAGLVISPLNHGAGGRLAAGIKQLLSGQPITATTVGSQVLVMFGYKNAQQLLHPSSTLANDPTFKSALGSLPAGSKAAMYLDFGPIAAFESLDHSASDAKVWKVVRRLRYLIAGGTKGHFRLVLATN